MKVHTADTLLFSISACFLTCCMAEIKFSPPLPLDPTNTRLGSNELYATELDCLSSSLLNLKIAYQQSMAQQSVAYLMKQKSLKLIL